MIRWILGLLLVAALSLGGLAAWRTQHFLPDPPVAIAALDAAPALNVKGSDAAERLGQAIRFQTISVQAGQPWDEAPFIAQRTWLESAYPAFHAVATREIVDKQSLLFTWTGSNPALAPMLLLAHLDVVPVEAWSQDQWKAEPFAGDIRDGFVWGRGAMDDKGSLITILEAANALAASGFKPTRTIIFAFGHDEEVSGGGAVAMAQVLKDRGVKAWFAMDEGMAIIANYPMTGAPVALIGIAEKGYATMRVTATATAGHSSTPPADTAITLLSEAIIRIHRMPITMRLEGGPGIEMVRALGPQLPLTIRAAAAANEWLFSPVINQQLGADPRAAALLRTTVAPTMLEGGPKENVLPGRATAMINFRLHPRDTTDSILAAAQEAVKGIPGVTLEWTPGASNASPVSSTTSDSYALISAVARDAGGGAPVAPTLVLGATDSRHYAGIAENVYRFTPALLTDEEIAGVHGVSEKLSVENVERMITGYGRLIAVGAGPAN